VSARKDKGRLPPFVPVDLEMMNSPAWRAGGMSVEPRHYCRNLKCRSKLPAPIENVRKAFCCRGCHSAFYRTRCLVCEKDTGTNPLTGEKRKRLGQRKFCGRKCKAEARQFPHVYAGVLPDPVRRTRT
jgi:hypothetical protein